MTHRYQELDSLRGLAAITVLVGHYLNPFLVQSGPYVRVGRIIQLAGRTPLFALFAGHEAVMLFFVLSGFVLSLNFLKGASVRYGAFALKRVCRLYVPYLGALVLAVLCCRFAYAGRITELSDWFNTPWSGGVTSASLVEHVVFLGSFKSDRFDPVLWSLVHELRISFLLPFLVAFLMKRAWRTNLTLALGLSVFGMTARLAMLKLGIPGDYCLTIHYVAMFVMGFMLAQNVTAIHDWYRRLGPTTRAAIGLGGLVLYTFSHLLPGPLRYYQDLPIAIGASLIVVTGLSSARTSAFLKRPSVKFFGDISYSLYLYHAIVLLAFTHVLYGAVPMAAILPMACATSVLLAWVSYVFVERPAIKMGRTLSARWAEAGRAIGANQLVLER